jgi:hypothetical protein
LLIHMAMAVDAAWEYQSSGRIQAPW